MDVESIVSLDGRVPSWLAEGPLIERPRLIGRLDEATTGPVTFLTGPAGAGKSVLVDQWLAHEPGRLSVKIDFDPLTGAPLAVDPAADGSTGDLLEPVIEAISSTVGDGGVTNVSGAADRPLAADVLVERWLARADPAPPLSVVLDGLSPGGDPNRLLQLAQFLDRFMSGLGDAAHLVVVARRVPEAFEGLLTTGRDVAYIESEVLACSIDETLALVGARLRRPVSADVAQMWRQRTTGWITGIVVLLVAHAESGADDAAATVRANKLFDEYFERRVLASLPPDLGGFLVDAALMEGIDPSVCDAVLGRTDSRELLEDLTRRLCFVRRPDPLLARYELFPLLGESLVRRARRDDPRRAEQIGRVAAAHFHARVERLETIETLIDAKEWTRAIDLLGSIAAPSMADVDIERARRLARRIPIGKIRAHPSGLPTLVTYAIDLGDVTKATALLDAIEESAEATTWEGSTLRHAGRAALGRWHDDPASTIAHATQALALLDQAPAELLVGTDRISLDWTRALVRIYGAGALVRADRIEDALAWFRHAEESAVGIPHLVARALAEQALLQARFGWLDQALALADRSEAITLHATPHLSVRPEAFQARAVVATERDDLPTARAAIAAAQRSDRGRIVPEIVARNTLLGARLAMAERDFDKGLSLCGQWRSTGSRVGVGGLQPAIFATEIRLALAAGYADHARRLARAAPDPSALRGSLAWLDVAVGDVRTLSVRVDTWPGSPLTAARIEFHLYGALRADQVGRATDCADHLAAAARLAEPEGFSRVFLDAAPDIVELAVRTLPRFPSPWLARLVWRLAPESVPVPDRARPTARELQVLELLATEQSAGDIAARLRLSPSTLKSHLGRIYRKLGVSSRGEATVRALELGMIAPGDGADLARVNPKD